MRIDVSRPIHILAVRFTDGNGIAWLWDLEDGWLDIEYDPDEDHPMDSGYPAETWEEVMKIMEEGGYLDGSSN